MRGNRFGSRESTIPKRKQIDDNEKNHLSRLACPRSSMSSATSMQKNKVPLGPSPRPNELNATAKTHISPASDFFKTFPRGEMMNSRIFPDDLTGRPKIMGVDSQIDSLYRYTKNMPNSFHSFDLSPIHRHHVINLLSKLSNLEPTVLNRLKNGLTHRREELSSLCEAALAKSGKSAFGDKEKFVNITDEVDEIRAIEILGSFVDTLADNGNLPVSMISS
jgi:hypothetical protein